MEPTEHESPTPPPPTPGGGSSTGLEPNVAGALAYLLGPVTGILFLLLEKENRFVRFHAAQSTGLFVVFFVFWVVFWAVVTVIAAIPVLGWIIAGVAALLSLLLSLGGLVLWIFLMYKAFSGEEWEFPWVGAQSRKMIFKGEI